MAKDSGVVLIVLSAGNDEKGCSRAGVAFSLAVSLIALEKKVVIYLTGEGVCWGRDEAFHGPICPGFSTLDVLLEQFFSTGGTALACGVCLRERCTIEESSPEELQALLRPQFSIAGIATAATFIAEGAQVVSF